MIKMKKNTKSNNKQMKNIKMQNQIKSNQTYQPQNINKKKNHENK